MKCGRHYFSIRFQNLIGLALLCNLAIYDFPHPLDKGPEVGFKSRVHGRVVYGNQVGDFVGPAQDYAHCRFGAHAVAYYGGILQLVDVDEVRHVFCQVRVIMDWVVRRVAVISKVLIMNL